MPLEEYNRRRDFAATPEPSGTPRRTGRAKARALQFCVQKHDAGGWRCTSKTIRWITPTSMGAFRTGTKAPGR